MDRKQEILKEVHESVHPAKPENVQVELLARILQILEEIREKIE